MLKEFKLPELGENITTADVTQVLVKVGDKIEKDQIILEIETDKATIEVPADFGGDVKEVFIKEGEKAEVGKVILKIETDSNEESNTITEVKEEQKRSETKTEQVKKEIFDTIEMQDDGDSVLSKESGIVDFKLPELGENISSADVSQVFVKPGDKVKIDQIILEIETDKATVEVPSDVEGIVKEVFVKTGEKAEVGKTIITVETTVSKKTTSEKPLSKEESKTVSSSTAPVITTKSAEPAPSIQIEKGSRKDFSAIGVKDIQPGKLAPAAPSVRRFAREIGVDINTVSGTGPGNRITIEDVKLHSRELYKKLKEQPTKSGFGFNAEPLPDFEKFGTIEKQAMSNVRRKTAEHLSYAWATIPHVTQFDKADITELEKFRKLNSKKVEAAGGKLTVTAILIKLLSLGMKKFPQFNSSIDMEKSEIIYKKYFNVGVAVDTDRGLIVPVIKNVDQKSLTQISVELNEISEKARNKKIGLEDMQGGCITISNLGGIGGTYFTPIVNSPEVAILGVSRGIFEPVYIDGEFVPRLMLPLSLSYDHRIIDGADAIRFLRWMIEIIEDPMKILIEI